MLTDQAARVAPVGNYEKALDETVPYIGATAVQNQGYDGTGIKVAVIDSGIDYLHANLGGSGDPAANMLPSSHPASQQMSENKKDGSNKKKQEIW